MLTRDIALHDAILDLLDNCLDGVVISQGIGAKKSNDKYYEGFYAEITIRKDSFEIKDNCGGISRDVAEKKAFRMGRSTAVGEGLPTVGIYGIGMKRAIFKIGKEAEVISKYSGGSFSVKIPENWAELGDDNWQFPIKDLKVSPSDVKGTHIIISKLSESVESQWSDKNSLYSFENELRQAIQASYSLIIEKGFKIKLNGQEVTPFKFDFLFSYDKGKKKDWKIQPYLFKRIYDECVDVHLIVGFYATIPNEDETEERLESKRSSPEAGWTIVCNDRIIIFNDKTHLTGWGEAGIPQYHTQFIGIRGLVIFESSKPEKLPMTTTKRGIDLSSAIFADVKNKMREGLKIFTNYTNQWKGRNEQERLYSNKTTKVSHASLSDESWLKGKGVNFKNNKDGSSISQPKLPRPSTDKDYEYIRFTKPKDDIDMVKDYLWDASIDVKPSKIGEECFDRFLHKAKNGS